MIMKTEIRFLDKEKAKLEDALEFFRSIEAQVDRKDSETYWPYGGAQQAFLISLQQLATKARIVTEINIRRISEEIEIEKKREESYERV